MSLPNQALHDIASRLQKAQATRTPIETISKGHPQFNLEDAYAVQTINATRSLKEGNRLVGYKIGLTSPGAQKQLGLTHPDFGHLFDRMSVPNEGEVDSTTLIQPKIEGELAFVLGKDLKGPGITIVDVLSAVDYALVTMEIVDSRIENWKISAEDTVADNGSSALFVLSSTKRDIRNVDLSAAGMALSKNGEVWITGAGSAVMGNPLNAVVFLANELGRMDKAILAGDVILSGSFSSMIAVAPGDIYTCEIGGMGRCSVRFTSRKEVK